MKRLGHLFNCFCDMDDPERPGFKFFASNAKHHFLKSIKWVQAGKLSDPLNDDGSSASMYLRIGQVESTGLPTYLCLRGSSALEVTQHVLRLPCCCPAAALLPMLWSFFATVLQLIRLDLLRRV